MKRISTILGAATFAAILGIVGLLLSGIQIGQANQQASDDDRANATLVAIENEQSERLAAGATMVALQEQQLQNLEQNATIIAIQQRQLFAIEEMATLQAADPENGANATEVAERMIEVVATNEFLEDEREKLARATPISPSPSENCSEDSWIPTEITFVNRGNETVLTYWIDYDCEEVLYQTVDPGYQYTQQTFVTHPWVIRNRDGVLIKSFIVTDSKQSTVTIR